MTTDKIDPQELLFALGAARHHVRSTPPSKLSWSTPAAVKKRNALEAIENAADEIYLTWLSDQCR